MRAAGRLLTGGVAAAALLGALPGVAAAADGAPIDSGDTAWLLMSTALVMVMLPGLALFYGGLVRRKNVLSTVMHSFFGLALVEHRVGADRLLAGVRHGRRRAGPHRRPRLRRVHGRRPRTVDRLRRDDPVHPVRRVPAHVRGHHPGADQRRLRRAQALRRVRAVHGPVVDLRLLPDRPLGLVGRRLAVQARRARLRRRHRRPRLVRHLGAHRRAAHRPPGRQRRRPRAPRHPDDGPRRRPPVVRLVRLQRRLRHGGRRPRGERAAGDQHRRRGRHDQLGAAAVRQQEEGLGRRRRLRRGRGPRRDHPGLGLRHRGWRPRHRPRWSAASATA